MLITYFKLAFRALWRRKFTTGLNVMGLALGIATFFFLVEIASFHASFEGFHTQAERIYRIVGTTPLGTQDRVSPMMVGLRERFSGIESIPTFVTDAGGVVSYKSSESSRTVAFKEENVAYGNNDVFHTFSFSFLVGNSDLDKPNTMVITSSAAQKYFACGENFQSVLGKRLLVANQFTPVEYIVTGVIRDMPENSDFRLTMLFSLQTLANPANLGGNESWARLTPDNTSGFLTAYIMLREGISPAPLEAQMLELTKKLAPTNEVVWHLQPLRSIHTGSGFGDPLPNGGALKLVMIALSIGIFVLSLAWINYINLSTAFGLARAREIGVRKTIGATRAQLMMPHFIECAVLTIAALLLALTVVELLQPSFNTMLGVKLHLGYVFTYTLGAWGIAVMLLGTALSGIYVALVLTGINPLVVLRGSFARSTSGSRIRKALVVVQFAVSIAFIASTFIIVRQLDYMRHRDLGMKLEQLVVIDGPALLDDEAPGGAENSNAALTFKKEVMRLPFVRQVAGSQNIPGQGYGFSTEGVMRPTGQKEDAKKSYNILLTDENYFSTYGMTFAAGKGFQTTDNLGNFTFRNVVINEAAALQLGFQSPMDAIGQYVQWKNGNDGKGQQFQIGGVLKNYHHTSLHGAIKPLVILPSEAISYLSIRIVTDNIRSDMQQLEKLYKQILPGNPFVARFADDIFQKQYDNEVRSGNLFALFSIIAIVIACLGLFGLAAFAAESRRKEIGVRKVLGASDVSIIGLLSKDFLKLIAIAFVIASPISFWLMGAWLQDFAYHVDLRSFFGVAVFAVAGLLAVVIAFSTIAAQAWKTARTNAIESLRYE